MTNHNRKLWTLLGLTAGAAVGAWLWRRGTERTAPAEVATEPVQEGTAADRLTRALAEDLELGEYDLSVDAISDGVVELTGAVDAAAQRERAVAMAHAIGDVHTVVNRLVLRDEEARFEANRTRREEKGGMQHSGMGVGMGTRRQSPDTDPDRPSDRQKLVDRELEPENMEAVPADETGTDPDEEEATP